MSARTYPILENVIKYFPNHSHIYVTSTTGGTHSRTSYHFRGEAIDVGSSSQVYKDQLAAWLYPHYSHITELLHTKAGDTGGWYVKLGQKKPHGWYGRLLDQQHINHVHLAVSTVSQANALLASVKSKSSGNTNNPHPTLDAGATGSAVKTLQSRLNAHGFRVAVDGAFGPHTLAAVRSFQFKNKLHVDGECGKLTWAALLK